jgi:tryptophanyl-tRNA synthetase
LHLLDLGQEGVHDVGQSDLVEINPLLCDQPKQQVEWSGEDIGVDLVRHRCEVTGHVHAKVGYLKDPGVSATRAAPSILLAMERVFSGVQSSGAPHIGNYFGAFRQWVADQHCTDSVFCVVDLHTLTVEQDPALVRRRTLEIASWLFASGLDPEVCIVFAQSHVHEHTALSWLLECTATFGELRRMTQFKEKSKGNESVSAGLFTYPALMAADILLYDTNKVPVGDDQRQHLELTRDLAIRFNGRYGETFVVPEAVVPKVAARVMDLQHPDRKMSKSVISPLGTIDLSDDSDAIAQKVRKAVTDTDAQVRYDPEHKPGLSNLIELFAAATGRPIDDVTASYDRYGPLKADLAEALVEVLTPVRERYAEMTADPASVPYLLEKGALKASAVASQTLRRAQQAIGLLPRIRDNKLWSKKTRSSTTTRKPIRIR